jgi:phage-related protein
MRDPDPTRATAGSGLAGSQRPDDFAQDRELEPNIAVRHRGDAYRAVYAVQLDDDVWALHAFGKKSKTGIKTPRREIDLIRERIKRVKEQLP